jgi:hypothetical protein
MPGIDDYKHLLSEIIRKQIDILGPEIAIQKARGISALKVSEEGTVESISGDPARALQDLVNVYISLSGEIVKNILTPVFEKYPEIKLDLKS